MISVRIPPTLRAATGGEKRIAIDQAVHVGEVLAALVEAHPGLRDALLDPDGQPNRFVNIYLDDVDIRHLAGLATPVPADATLTLLPAMAGGCGCGGTIGQCARAMGRCMCPGRARRA
jgi:molybdopterin synthase sulfur carrier subunit